ncbi:hypothetical protein TNCV_1446661 [Trichonephila clavipes]|nr:hypothetical protein TNCV_1446661 [Trichonephila clavipes]
MIPFSDSNYKRYRNDCSTLQPQTRSRPAYSASEAEILSTVRGGVVFVPAIGLVTGTERLISFDWITAVMKGGVLDQGWQQLRTVELLWLVSKHLLKEYPCREITIHLQTSMPSPGFESKSFDTTVSVGNHYSGWVAFSRSFATLRGMGNVN